MATNRMSDLPQVLELINKLNTGHAQFVEETNKILDRIQTRLAALEEHAEKQKQAQHKGRHLFAIKFGRNPD